MANKKIPITRISKFFGSEDFQLEQDIGMEWLHGDMHFTLVLFRVDQRLSDVDDVYGESGPEEIRSAVKKKTFFFTAPFFLFIHLIILWFIHKNVPPPKT